MPRSTKTGAPPSLVAFYDVRDRGEDAHGRTLDEILKWGKFLNIDLELLQAQGSCADQTCTGHPRGVVQVAHMRIKTPQSTMN